MGVSELKNQIRRWPSYAPRGRLSRRRFCLASAPTVGLMDSVRGFQKFILRNCLAKATLSVLLASAAAAYEHGALEEGPEPFPGSPPVTDPAQGRLEWGDLLWLGKSCQNWDETPVIATPYRLYIPLRNWLKREDGTRTHLGSCQFSLPLKVPTGFRLVIYALSAQGVTNLAPFTEATLKAEVLLTTDKKIRISDQQQAINNRQANLNILVVEDELIGDCGQSWILKGNTETQIRGGKGLSTAKIDQFAIDYELQKCSED